MDKKPSIADIIANYHNHDKTLEEQAANLGELIMEKEHEESVFGRDTQRINKLEKIITLQKKLILRMINGDEEEFLPLPPKKPYLRIVK